MEIHLSDIDSIINIVQQELLDNEKRISSNWKDQLNLRILKEMIEYLKMLKDCKLNKKERCNN